MSGDTVVVTSRSFATVDPAPERDLAQAGFTVVRAGARHDPAELARVLPEAVAWIAGTGPVTDDLLALCPGLRLVARYGVGYDAVDLEAATRRGLWVTITPGTNSEAVADLTLALLLDSLRHVTVGAAAVAAGDWSVRRGRELGALTYSPVAGVDLVALDDLLSRCDVVSLHAPGGHLLLDADRLSGMRLGVTVVNTARADLVDEAAMATALRAGRVAGYACDTLAAEHAEASSPLLATDLTDRVLVTPHLGGQTDEAINRMGRMAADEVLAVLRGDPPQHPINEPEVVG